MIARTHRFHGYNSLSYVYKNGSAVRGPQSALKYVYNPKRSTYRVAVVVGRKVHKSAVVRNRLRRRIYEAVRLHEPVIDKPFDLVFTVFNEQFGELSAVQLQNLIHSQLKKAGVLDFKPTGQADSVSNHGIVGERKRL